MDGLEVFKIAKCNIDRLILRTAYPGGFEISGAEYLTIGDGTVLNAPTIICAAGSVCIGRYCHCGRGLTIYSVNHNWKSDCLIPYDNKLISRPVIIGDVVWIGMNVTIAPGATIGNGAIISIGSVVFGDVPACAVVRGNPAKIIKYRDEKVFKRLYDEEKFF